MGFQEAILENTVLKLIFVAKNGSCEGPGKAKMRLPSRRGAIFDINRVSKLEAEKRGSGGGFSEAILVLIRGPKTKFERFKVAFKNRIFFEDFPGGREIPGNAEKYWQIPVPAPEL